MLFLFAFAVFFVLSVLPLAAFVLRHFGVFGQLSRFFLSLPLHLRLPSDLVISFFYAVPLCIRCFLCSFCPSTGCVCAATLWCFRSTFRAFFFRFLSTCG